MVRPRRRKKVAVVPHCKATHFAQPGRPPLRPGGSSGEEQSPRWCRNELGLALGNRIITEQCEAAGPALKEGWLYGSGRKALSDQLHTRSAVSALRRRMLCCALLTFHRPLCPVGHGGYRNPKWIICSKVTTLNSTG